MRRDCLGVSRPEPEAELGCGGRHSSSLEPELGGGPEAELALGVGLLSRPEAELGRDVPEAVFFKLPFAL